MNIDHIIGKVLSGQASEEELKVLEQWKKEAEDNISAIKEMHVIDDVMTSTSSYKSYDVETALEKVMHSNSSSAKIKTLPNTTPPHKSQFSWKWLVAACMIGVVGYLGLTTINSSTEQENIVKTTDAISDIVLADGSSLQMDKFSAVQKLSARKVSLEGRAFFDIVTNPEDPFEIELPQGKVTVLGTEFVIDTRHDIVQIYVKEGRVAYQLNNRKIELTAGNHLVVQNGEMVKVPAYRGDMTIWTKGKLAFRDKSIVEVAQQLTDFFGKRILVEPNAKLVKCKVNTSIKDETFEEVLNELSLTLGLKYESRDGIVYIVDSNC